MDGGNGLDYQFDARAFIGVSEWWELVPAVSVRGGSFKAADLSNLASGRTYNTSTDNTPRNDTNITDVDIGWWNVDVGLAAHMSPVEFVDFWIATGAHVFGAEHNYQHAFDDNPNPADPNNTITRDPASNTLEDSRDSISGNAFPYVRMAIEARVFSWLDLRAGVVKYLRSDKQVQQTTDRQDNAGNLNNDFTQDYPFFDYFVGWAVHYEGFFLDMQMDPLWFKRGPNFLSGQGGADMFLNGSLGYKFQ